jgi:hypothetical protein
VNSVFRHHVGEDEIGDLVRLKTFIDRGLHRNIGGMPKHDELTECQVSERSAEVVIVDKKLRGERIDFHTISLQITAVNWIGRTQARAPLS